MLNMDTLGDELTNATYEYLKRKVQFTPTKRPNKVMITFPFNDDYSRPIKFYAIRDDDTIELKDHGLTTDSLINKGTLGLEQVKEIIHRFNERLDYPMYFDDHQMMMQAIYDDNFNVYRFTNDYVRVLITMITMAQKGSD